MGITNNNSPSDTLKTCNGCHVLDPSGNSQYSVTRPGFFGTDGQSSFENETQLFKVPHLRNLYQKVGKFGMSPDPLFPADQTPPMGDQIRGFGFLHDGSIDTLFRFHGAKVFDKSIINPGGISSDAAGDTIRNQLTAFMLAFDSNLAPVVGQQISLTQTNSGVAGPRIDLLESRAAAGECDLVAKGIANGQAAGYLYNPQQKMFTTPNPFFTISDAGLRALAQNAGGELTFTCTPPGSGVRIAAEPVIGPTPTATTAGLVSAANPTPGSAISPGSMASLYGTNLSNAKLLAGAPLPFELGGTSITVDNVAAPLFYVSPLQVNFQVPSISIVKPTQVPLRITQGESFTTITVTLKPYAPALFTTNGQGSGQASAMISNTPFLAAPIGTFPGSRPAKKGEFVSLFCTGLGAVSAASTTLAAPTVSLGAASAPVSFSGLAPGFVGLYQVNFQIPTTASSGSAVAVVLMIGGSVSNTATIAIQ
jgi:uncharacterized protein (TIGR03437 family)